VELGNTYEVDIIDMSPNGEGIARVKGYPIFVAHAKLGEHVKAKIVDLNSVSADAEIATEN
jgi:predicted RNA-binding protein with TRAM domain